MVFLADLGLSQSGLFYEGWLAEIWRVIHLPLSFPDFLPSALDYLRDWNGDPESPPIIYGALQCLKHLLFALNSAVIASFLWNKYHKPPDAERDPLAPATALLRRWIESGDASFPVKDPLKLPKAWTPVHDAAVLGLFSALDGHPRDWRGIARALAAYFPYIDRARQSPEQVSALGEALLALEMQSMGEPDPKIMAMGKSLLAQSLRMNSKLSRSWRAPLRWGLLEDSEIDAHISQGLASMPEDPYLNAWSLTRKALKEGPAACEAAVVILKKKYSYFIETPRFQAELLAAAGKREASIESFRAALNGRPLDRALGNWARKFAPAAYGEEGKNLAPLDEASRRPEPSSWADGAMWSPERPLPPKSSLRFLALACVALSFSSMAFEVEKAKHYFVGIDGIWKCAGLGLDNGDWIPESAFPGTLVSRDEKLKHDFVEESAWVHSGGLEVLGGHIARYYTGQYHDYSCDEHRDGWTFDAWGDSLAAKASATLNDGRLWLKYGDASFKLVFQRPGLWYPVTRNSELRSCTGDCDENGAISTAPPTQFISRPSPTPEPTMDWSGYRRRDYYQDY